jgi:cell division protein FtsA
MNNSQNIVTAINISTSNIVTVIGRIDNKSIPEILGLSRTETRGFANGIVSSKVDLVNSILYTIDEVQKQTGIVINEVYVGIAGLQIKYSHNKTFITRNLNDDEISERDTDRLIEKAFNSSIPRGEEIISIIPQSYTIDGEKGIKSPYGCNGLRFELEYLIVTDQFSSASQIKHCINLSGINVKEIILAPVALSASILTSYEREAGVLLVAIQANYIDIAVYYDGQIKHLAIINVIKTHSHLIGIIDVILTHLDASGYRENLGAGIVILGGGEQLNEIAHSLKLRTGLEVRTGQPTHYISPNHLDKVSSSEYSLSVGLLILGFEKL